MQRRPHVDTLGTLTRKGTEMASARRRGKTFMGLYWDAEGRQRSTGSFATKKGSALEAAAQAENAVLVAQLKLAR